MRKAERDFIQRCEAFVERGTKPTILEIAPLVREYYEMPDNGAGGSLHIILEDENCDMDSVCFCEEYARKKGDVCGEALAKVFALMSETQRRKVRHVALANA